MHQIKHMWKYYYKFIYIMIYMLYINDHITNKNVVTCKS